MLEKEWKKGQNGVVEHKEKGHEQEVPGSHLDSGLIFAFGRKTILS